MKFRVAVFPFTEQLLPVVRHFNLLQDVYDIRKVIARKGMGLSGKDVAFLCNHPPVGIPVTDMDNADDESWDILLVNYSDLDPAADCVMGFLRNCLKEGKEIMLLCDSIDCEKNKFIAKCCADFPSQITVLSADAYSCYHHSFAETKFEPLRIPVLMIGSLIKQSDPLEVLISLKLEFLKHNRHISCLTTSNMGLLAGMHSYTHIVNNRDAYSEEDKIILLNQLARNIIRKERPELLLVEAPDAVMKYNDVAPNGFGIQTYMISLALQPNLFVCCVPMDLTDQNFIAAISKDFSHRYSCAISAVQVSNSLIDSMSIAQNEGLSSVHADMDMVCNAIHSATQNQIFPIFDVVSQGAQGMYEHICSLL